MKDSNLILGSKETLTKEQMRKINGGICFVTCPPNVIQPLQITECDPVIIGDICQTHFATCMC